MFEFITALTYIIYCANETSSIIDSAKILENLKEVE